MYKKCGASIERVCKDYFKNVKKITYNYLDVEGFFKARATFMRLFLVA
jgi:hypothetical protein